MTTVRLLACLTALVPVTACSGSESSGNGNGDGDGATAPVCEVQFEIDGALTLGELSQEQTNHLCDAYGELILCTFSEPALCRVEGIAAARSEGTDSPETCRSAEAECLLEGSKTRQEWEEPCEGSAILTGCSVTVAELRQCWNDLFARSADIQTGREQDSCDDVAAYFEWVETAQDEQYPPSCDTFLACQELQ